MKSGVLVIVLGALAAGRLDAQKIKLPASLGDLQKAAAKDSNDAAAHYNVALAYWNEKRWDDVDSALHRAIRLDPRFAAAYMALSALPYARHSNLADDIAEGRLSDDMRPIIEVSDRVYRQAVMIDPLVEVRIGDVIRPRSTPYLDVVQDLFGEWVRDYLDGLDQYYLGKYQQAYDRFQRVVLETKGDRHADRLWNTLLYWHGLAAAQLRQNTDAVWDIGTILERYEDLEQAKKDTTLHVPLRTNEFRYLLAFMKQRAGQFNEAIDLYRKALENDLGLYMAHVQLAQIYEDHNMFPQAVAERRAAINANPDDPSLETDLGRTLARAGQWIDAEQALQQAVAGNPRDPRPHYFLGIIEQHQNKTAEARTAFRDFIALAPSRYAPQVADARQRLDALH
jgi:tetratricopeptide (TPR) repeat protein